MQLEVQHEEEDMQYIDELVDEEGWAEDDDIDMMFPDLPYDPSIELPPIKKIYSLSTKSTQQETQVS